MITSSAMYDSVYKRYFDTTRRHIIKHFKFLKINKNVERVNLLLRYWITVYQVPTIFKRDMYWEVMRVLFPMLRKDILEKMLNEAYPQKTETNSKTIIKEIKVNTARI